MLNETNIRCFLILAETLNFTETARRVYLTQQAVSKNINNLESSLGFLLFLRSKHSISLTEEGRACFELFRELDGIYTERIDRLRAAFVKTSSSIRVGYQNFLELGSALINANNAMRRDFPDAQLLGTRHSPGTLNKLFSEGQLDLIIICARYLYERQEYERHVLMRVPAVILVSPDNPNVSEDATYLDFKNEPYIVDIFENESRYDFDRRVEGETAMCGLTPSEIIAMPNRESAYSSAELDNGVLLGSEISQIYKGSRLLRYRTESVEDISCIWKKGQANPLVLKYIDHLKYSYKR